MKKSKKPKRDWSRFPRWLTDEQAELLKYAEKGLLPADVVERCERVMSPLTKFDGPEITIIDDKWDGREDKAETIKFTDHPMNRLIHFLMGEFGWLMAALLFDRMVNHKQYPKAEAERLDRKSIRHYSRMRKTMPPERLYGKGMPLKTFPTGT